MWIGAIAIAVLLLLALAFHAREENRKARSDRRYFQDKQWWGKR